MAQDDLTKFDNYANQGLPAPPEVRSLIAVVIVIKKYKGTLESFSWGKSNKKYQKLDLFSFYVFGPSFVTIVGIQRSFMKL